MKEQKCPVCNKQHTSYPSTCVDRAIEKYPVNHRVRTKLAEYLISKFYKENTQCLQ